MSPPGPPKLEIRNLPKDFSLLVLSGTFGIDIDGNVWQYEDGGQGDQDDQEDREDQEDQEDQREMVEKKITSGSAKPLDRKHCTSHLGVRVSDSGETVISWNSNKGP